MPPIKFAHVIIFTYIVLTNQAYSADIMLDATGVYESVRPSLCTVSSLDPFGREIGTGSGFVISKSGNVATNAHVVSGSSAVRVECGNYSGTVSGVINYQSGIDLVILKTDLEGITPLTLSAAEEFKPGTNVFALGNPYGLQGTITSGIIGGFREFNGVNYIQISADINPGNSGGPIVIQSGEVVGIATMGLENAQGLNFALPAYLLEKITESNLTFKDIAKINKHEVLEVKLPAAFSFRELPLGSKCDEISKQGDLITEQVASFVKIKGSEETQMTFTSIYGRPKLNSNGVNYIKHKLMNMDVVGVYSCSDGILYSAGYIDIPDDITHKIKESLILKYGKPKLTKANLKNVFYDKYAWSIGENQSIVLTTMLMDNRVIYTDNKLKNYLEKLQTNKTIKSGDL